MNFEDKLKKKFLYNEGKNFFKTLYFLLQKFKLKGLKKNFTVTGVDLLVERFFSNINVDNGIYVDIGCNHPFYNNNTFLLHQKGWSGINVDLDFHSIDMFNYFRPKDVNKQIAVSDKIGEQEFFFYHSKSTINTLSSEIHNLRGHNAKEIRRIKIDTLDNIIEHTVYANKKINFLTIDVEGYELNVLKGFNFKKYEPDMVIVEYIDTSIKQEFFYQSISNIINSELFNFMNNNNFSFVNWLDSDLVFVNNNIRI